MLGTTVAALAGLFASMASVCAKLAMAEESTLLVCEAVAQTLNWLPLCKIVSIYIYSLHSYTKAKQTLSPISTL